jgi:hypothetical protein
VKVLTKQYENAQKKCNDKALKVDEKKVAEIEKVIADWKKGVLHFLIVFIYKKSLLACETSTKNLASVDEDIDKVQERIDKIKEECVGKIQKRLDEVMKEIKEIDVCVRSVCY